MKLDAVDPRLLGERVASIADEARERWPSSCSMESASSFISNVSHRRTAMSSTGSRLATWSTSIWWLPVEGDSAAWVSTWLTGVAKRKGLELARARVGGADDLPEASEATELDLDGVTVDVVGKDLGVHCATAARRLAQIKPKLRASVEEAVARRLGLAASEVAALRTVVDEQLDWSLTRTV